MGAERYLQVAKSVQGMQLRNTVPKGVISMGTLDEENQFLLEVRIEIVIITMIKMSLY